MTTTPDTAIARLVDRAHIGLAGGWRLTAVRVTEIRYAGEPLPHVEAHR
jgi:hypothetical protein